MRASLALAIMLALAACERAPVTPAEIAARGSSSEMSAVLDRDPALLSEPVNGDTLLRIAAREGNVAALRILIRRGASLDAADAKGRTALHLAAAANRADAARMLVLAGANWKLEDADGRTPLLVAVAAKSRDAADALREAASGVRLRPVGGPPSDLYGPALRRTAAERVFTTDTAGRARQVSIEWSQPGAVPQGLLLRLQAGERGRQHRDPGAVHALVATGRVVASAENTNDVELGPGGFVTIPKDLPHGWRCERDGPCLVFEERGLSNLPLAVVTTSSSHAMELWSDGYVPCSGRLDELAAGMTAGDHDHPFEFFVFVLEGTMSYSFDGDAMKDLPPGSVAVIPARRKHALRCAPGTRCLRYYEQCGE